MIAFNLPAPRFEVGQIVTHRRYGYRGVIVGRDLSCQAPKSWYQKNRTQPDRNQPWYHVIVDQSDTTTYPAESSLELYDGGDVAISNPMMQLFFEEHDGDRYVRNEVPFKGWD